MSAELSAIEALAADFNSGIYRLSPLSLAVLFYATPYLTSRYNWKDRNIPLDEITDADWDTISSYVDGLLYEVKNPMVGYIMAYMTESPPPNVLPCDGTQYAREDYPELYEVLASVFIVDDDNFTVPDLRGRTVVGAGDGSGLASRSIGQSFGEEDHQLSVSELASHSHSIELTTSVPGVAPGEVGFDVTVPFVPDATGNTGGDVAHNNIQPSYVLNYGVIAS